MPGIQQYQQRTQASGQLPELAPGANIAAIAGDTLDRVSQNVERVAEHDDNVDVAKALAQLRMSSAKRMADGETTAADDAAGFTADRMKEFDQDRDELAKSTRSPRAAAVFKHQAEDARGQIYERALGFEASRRAAYRTEAATDALNQSRAVLEIDPTQYNAVRAEQLGAIPTIGLEPAERLRLASNIDKELSEGAAIGIAKQRPAEVLTRLSSADARDTLFAKLAPDSRHRIEAFAKGQLADQTAKSVVDAYRVDARAGTKALLELDKSKLPPDVLDEARAKAREGLGLLHAERRQQYNDQVTTLERSITQGTPSSNAEGEALGLYHRGVYTPEQYTNVLQALDESRQRGAAKRAEVATVQAAIASGARLDPKDEKIVKAVDSLFTTQMDASHIAPGTDEWVNTAAALANKTNILPPEAMSWARKTILSGEPQLAVPAANAIKRWSDAAPAAYAYFDDPQLKANAEAIDSMVRAGVNPAKAVEIARANTYDIPKPRQDALKASYTKQKFAADNASELKSAMDGDDAFDRTFGPVGSPPPPLAMQDEYGALVRTYFDHTNGDIKQARELAWKDIRGTYGVSTVNGAPEVLKYAPELVYPGIDPAVIRSDIDEAAKGAGIKTPVNLTPANITGDTRGLRWNLTTTDEHGNVEPLLDDKNRPLIYEIPTDTARYVEAAKAAKAKAVEAAREQSRKAREMNATVGAAGAWSGY